MNVWETFKGENRGAVGKTQDLQDGEFRFTKPVICLIIFPKETTYATLLRHICHIADIYLRIVRFFSYALVDFWRNDKRGVVVHSATRVDLCEMTGRA